MSKHVAAWLVFLLGAAACGAFEEELRYRNRTLRDWLIDLRSPTPGVRLRASRALVEVGPEAEDAAPALLVALKTDDPIVRERLCRSLARIGPTQVPILTALLGFDDARQRRGAARALGLLGPVAKPAAPALKRRLNDAVANVRVEAALALWRVTGSKDGAETLRAAFFANTGPLRLAAARALGEMAPNKEKIARTLLVGLLSQSEEERRAVRAALVAMGAASVPGLRAELTATSAVRRQEAAEVLGRIGPAAQAAVADLVKRLGDPVPGPRVTAARALGRIGAKKDVLRPLRKALRDRDGDVKQEAALALAALGDSADATLEALRDLVQDSRGSVRRKGAAALVRLGNADVFVKLLDDPDNLVRRQAVRSLGEVGGAEAAQALRKSLEVPGLPRLLLVQSLGRMGATARPASAELVALLAVPDAETRRAAVQALVDVDAPSKVLVPALRKALKDRDGGVRRTAARGLSAAGKDAIDDLKGLLEDEAAGVAAGEAVVLLGHGKELLPRLRTLLADKRPRIRLTAARLLAFIGPGAKAARDELRKALEDEEIDVRLEAARALWEVEEAGKEVAALYRDVLGRDGVRAHQAWILTQLAVMGAAAKPSATTLATIAREDEHPGFRLAALRALVHVAPGKADAEVLAHWQRLKRESRDEMDEVRDGARTLYRVRVALEKVDARLGREALEVVRDLYRDWTADREPLWRLMGQARRLQEAELIDILAEVGRKAPPELVKAVERRDGDSRSAVTAARVRWLATKEVGPLLPLLRRVLREESRPRVRQAVALLRSLGAAARPLAADLDWRLRQADAGPALRREGRATLKIIRMQRDGVGVRSEK